MRSLPPEAAELVDRLVGAAQSSGLGLYLVGGVVRDLLLSRALVDVDLVLVAPDAARGAAAALARGAVGGDAKVVEHGRFGTVRIEMAEAKVDLALSRREQYRTSGALPSVEPAGLEEDLFRRDFGVNALAVELTAREEKTRLRVIDPTGGLEDLEKRRLRVLHPRSFHDDPTRALRAARLAPRLGFSLARSTRSQLRNALRDGAFGSVSGDRLRREIEILFSDAERGLDPVLALKRLAKWDLLPALEPGLSLPEKSLGPIRRLGRAVATPPWRSGRFRPFVSGLALWFSEFSPALRNRTLQRFSIRGETASRIKGFARVRDQKIRALTSSRGRGSVDAILAAVDEETLHALYAAASAPGRRRIMRWAAEDRVQRVPVTGTDLVQLGLEGPALGRILARIRAGFLDGELANREEALTLAEELIRSRAGRSGRARAAKKRPSRAKNR